MTTNVIGDYLETPENINNKPAVEDLMDQSLTTDEYNDYIETQERVLKMAGSGLNFIDENKIVYSEERLEDLKNLKKFYTDKKNELLNINKELAKGVEVDIPGYKVSLSDGYTTIATILEKGIFNKPNVKVTHLSCNMTTTKIVDIIFTYDQNKVEGGGNTWKKTFFNTNERTTQYNYKFESSEYLTDIQFIYIEGLSNVNYPSAVKFNTTTSLSDSQTKNIIPPNIDLGDETNKERKEFCFDPTSRNWWQSAKNPTSRSRNEAGKPCSGGNWKIASIADDEDNNRAIDIFRKYSRHGAAWIGGQRKNWRNNDRNVNTRGSSSAWKWLDGTQWDYTNWNRGEPNHYGFRSKHQPHGEPIATLLRRNGKWNDIGWARYTNRGRRCYWRRYYRRWRKICYNTRRWDYTRMPAIYSRTIIGKYHIEKYSIRNSDEQLTPGLRGFYSARYVTDTSALEQLNILVKKLKIQEDDLNKSDESKRKEYHSNLLMIEKLELNIAKTQNEIDHIEDLNEGAVKDPYKSSRGEGFTNFFEGFKNIFSNNMREGLENEFTSDYADQFQKVLQWIGITSNKMLTYADGVKENANRNFITELAAQKDNLFSNVLMDYMINETDGTTVEKVYNQLNHENMNKLRKIKINNYYTKTYKEYTYLLKIIVVLVIIMIPLLLLNRNKLLSKNITLTLVVVIIFLGALYILYRLYLLYIKDNINFDKDNIPFSRKDAKSLNESGSLYKKKGSSGLGITCIGSDCCTDGMIYNNVKHKCVSSNPRGVAASAGTVNEGEDDDRATTTSSATTREGAPTASDPVITAQRVAAAAFPDASEQQQNEIRRAVAEAVTAATASGATTDAVNGAVSRAQEAVRTAITGASNAALGALATAIADAVTATTSATSSATTSTTTSDATSATTSDATSGATPSVSEKFTNIGVAENFNNYFDKTNLENNGIVDNYSNHNNNYTFIEGFVNDDIGKETMRLIQKSLAKSTRTSILQ